MAMLSEWSFTVASIERILVVVSIEYKPTSGSGE